MSNMELKPRAELEKILTGIANKFEFKDAHLELSSDERMDSLLKFTMEHFAPDEPLGRSLGFEYDEETIYLFKTIFKENLSIMLISDQTGEIIACRTIALGKREEKFDWTQLANEKMRTMLTFTTQNDDKMDIYKFFDVDATYFFVQLGTHKEHRKQGIATKMMQAALLFCKEIGIINPACVLGEGTSNYSQKIYEKAGFEVMHTFNYDEYKVDGEIVFKNMEPHKSTKVYVKKL